MYIIYKYFYLLQSLFISITIISTIITIITVIIKYIVHQFSLLQLPSKFYFGSYLYSNSLLISNLISILSLWKLIIIVQASLCTIFTFSITFSCQLHVATVGEFKSMNLSGIVYLYLFTSILKLFLVIEFYVLSNVKCSDLGQSLHQSKTFL